MEIFSFSLEKIADCEKELERLRARHRQLSSRTVLESYDALGMFLVDGCWNQEDPEKWLTIIQVPV